MTRTHKAWIVRGRVQTAYVLPYIHLQIAVGAQQSPLRKSSPICKELSAVGATAHLVRCNERSDDMDRGRGCFQERRPWLCSSKMSVMVIKYGNISREVTGHLYAITGFIREKIF